MHTSWSIQAVRIAFAIICVVMGSMIGLGLGAAGRGFLSGLCFAAVLVGVDSVLGRFTFRRFSHATFGMGIGLLGAWLITQVGIFEMTWFQAVKDGDVISELLRLGLYGALAFLGASLALRSDRVDFAFVIPYVRFQREALEGEPLLLDANIVIDGRIPLVCKTGFITGAVLIPRFVLDELQRLADSRDAVKAERGKRGLAIARQMLDERDIDLSIHEGFGSSGGESEVPVDTRLVNLARELSARLLTNDENLATVARLRGVSVLSLHELARSLERPAAVGDEFDLDLVKPGKDRGQAVGYLADGSMVVVAQAASFVGQTMHVRVTGTTHTSGGRLVFAELKVE